MMRYANIKINLRKGNLDEITKLAYNNSNLDMNENAGFFDKYNIYTLGNVGFA